MADELPVAGAQALEDVDAEPGLQILGLLQVVEKSAFERHTPLWLHGHPLGQLLCILPSHAVEGAHSVRHCRLQRLPRFDVLPVFASTVSIVRVNSCRSLRVPQQEQ
jgi:hypothetical protein